MHDNLFKESPVHSYYKRIFRLFEVIDNMQLLILLIFYKVFFHEVFQRLFVLCQELDVKINTTLLSVR